MKEALCPVLTVRLAGCVVTKSTVKVAADVVAVLGAVGKHGLVFVVVLCGGSRECVGRRCRAGNVGERRAAVRAHFPLHGGGGRAAGRGGERGRCARVYGRRRRIGGHDRPGRASLRDRNVCRVSGAFRGAVAQHDGDRRAAAAGRSWKSCCRRSTAAPIDTWRRRRCPKWSRCRWRNSSCQPAAAGNGGRKRVAAADRVLNGGGHPEQIIAFCSQDRSAGRDVNRRPAQRISHSVGRAGNAAVESLLWTVGEVSTEFDRKLPSVPVVARSICAGT